MTNTLTIGAAGDETSIANWSATVKAIGTLTEDQVGQLIDDTNYTYGANSDLDFSGVTLSGFTITLEATTNKHDGDFGTGSRVETAVGFGGMYTVKQLNIKDVSFINTSATDNGSRVLQAITDGKITRVIGKSNSSGTNCQVFSFSTNGEAEASRANDGTVGFQIDNAGVNLNACSAIGSDTGYNSGGTHTGTIKNCLAFSTATSDWTGTYSGTYNNNASEDADHPGASGVTISGSPFEADGFTPSVSGQLDGAGADLNIVLDAANLAYDDTTPAIGAYATLAAATVTDVNTTEITVDAEADVTFTTSGFVGEITTFKITDGGSGISSATGVTSTGGAGDADLPDIAAFSSSTVGTPFTTANNTISYELSDGTATASLAGTHNPKTGWAVTEVLNAVKTTGSVFENVVEAVPNESEIYGPTANNTSYAADGTVTTDSTTNINLQWWDSSNATWKQITLLIVAPAITGTATPTINETDIINGGKTIIITLTGDTWLAAGTGPIGSTANTQAIIDGLTAATSPANGWNNQVRDQEVTTAVVRTSDTVCTITLTAQAGYNISSQETITVTVPAEAMTTSTSALTGEPTFTVDPVAATSTGISEGEEISVYEDNNFDLGDSGVSRTSSTGISAT